MIFVWYNKLRLKLNSSDAAFNPEHSFKSSFQLISHMQTCQNIVFRPLNEHPLEHKHPRFPLTVIGV